MQQPIQAMEFPWPLVPQEQREWLTETTGTIHRTLKRAVADLMRIGGLIAEAKSRLPHGLFESWAETQLPWTIKTTLRLSQVYRTFCESGDDALERFDVSALYALAQPSAPPQARDYALEMAGDGTRITKKMAYEIIAAQRTIPALTKSQTKQLARRDTDSEQKIAEEMESARTPEHRAFVALEEMLKSGRTIHLSGIVEEEESETELTGRVIEDKGKTKFAANHRLPDLVFSLAGIENGLVCRSCKLKKPDSAFAKRYIKNNLTFNYYCRSCERERIRKYSHSQSRSAAIA